MLKEIDLTKTMEKDVYKETIKTLELRLGSLQRQCRNAGIPVMILMEGLEVSGKGVQISKLMKALDPRGFKVYAISEDTKEEAMHPFLWKYWLKTPANGDMVIFNSSWYRKVTVDLFDKQLQDRDTLEYLEEIRCFEKQLIEGDTCIIKLFLYINKEEQKKRMDKLQKDKSSAWRVSKSDLKKNKSFDAYQMLVEQVLEATHTESSPWNIISTMDRRYATITIYQTVIHALEEHMKEVNRKRIMLEHGTVDLKDVKSEEKQKQGLLQSINLNKELTEAEYEEKLEKLQKKLEKLHGELYRKRIPMILGFEGWDAGGKGGAIKRLTEKMDPRGYVVKPVSSPNDIEKAHHYLWRFWNEIPKDGHVTIFDRTWYGRVMVERIEGFCTEKEWKRAYKEMNDMEASFVNAGAIVIKFWLHVDKEEQERRFIARQEDPEKQWKITDEDWRNREKWDAYEVAVNEMIEKTSTQEAPWVIVEGNDKKYARIKILETVIRAIEKRLKQ